MADDGTEEESSVMTGAMTDDTVVESSVDSPVDPGMAILQTVYHMIDDNIQHFKPDDSEQGQRLHSGFKALKDNLESATGLCEVVKREAHIYDFSPQCPGNGYRSFITIVQSAVLCVFDLCKQVCTSRDSLLLFRKGHYVREVEAWGQTIASLATIMRYMEEILLPRCQDGNLYPDIVTSPKELLSMLNTISQYSFYGRCVGFHFYDSQRKILRFLNIGMAAFSEIFYSDGSMISRTRQSVGTSSRYVIDPESRSRRIVDVVQYCGVDFIKAFWSMAETEIMKQLPGLVCPSLAVNQTVMVPCEEVRVQSVDGLSTVEIPAPQSHIPKAPITCQLLSVHLREGMPGAYETKNDKVLPKSENLIIHCHGGGFVTQSTKAQEVFLREWATALDVPILSIDYSLAPEARYPRPLEEVLTVYSWILNNYSLLGTNATKIILTGDSAGGNLITGLTIKCLELGIRPPDGLYLAYTPFMFDLIPSPARLLAVMDPLLPLGFALRCLKAYAAEPSNPASEASSPVDPLSNRTSSSCAVEVSAATLEQPNGGSDTESFVEICICLDQGDPDDGCYAHPVTESDVKEAEASMVKSSSFLSEPGSDTLTTVSLTSNVSKTEEVTNTESKNHPEDNDTKLPGREDADKETSRRYVSEFLEKYVLDSRTDKQGRNVPILRTGSEESEPEEETVVFEASGSGAGITAKLGKAKNAVMGGISAGLSSIGIRKKDKTPSPTSPPSSPTKATLNKRPSFGSVSLATTKLRREGEMSLLEEFSNVVINDDHYLSPLKCPEDILRKFPRTAIMTVEYDFCLDDNVTMAKLLKKCDVDVTLEILDKLPHGFLALNLVSKEANEGCKNSIARLKEMFEITDNLAIEALEAK